MAALGADAHAKLTLAGRVIRQMRRRYPAGYLCSADPVEERHDVPLDELAGEFMINALNLASGFATELFEQRHLNVLIGRFIWCAWRAKCKLPALAARETPTMTL